MSEERKLSTAGHGADTQPQGMYFGRKSFQLPFKFKVAFAGSKVVKVFREEFNYGAKKERNHRFKKPSLNPQCAWGLRRRMVG